ncbi:GNAT family N-acetyltransferase [Massilia cavernae]|nr:GNAT family N-acetyltransferase [Massilia cavernae]
MAKKVLHLLFREYSIYDIYACGTAAEVPPRSERSAAFSVREVGVAELAASSDAQIAEQSGYLGEEARAFACFDGSRIVGVCFYWYGGRYLKRNFWPLEARQAKLVHIMTLPEMRGREVATTLVAESGKAMGAHGFERNYARIWHSNTPSIRAFTRAGWQRVATVIELEPAAIRRKFRFSFRR